MDTELLLLWVAIAAYLCGAVTGVVAHMRWMNYSERKDRRSVSIALYVCAAAYGVAIAAMETRLILQGEAETAITGIIATIVCVALLATLVKVTSRKARR
ncbi:MAG: hypothetical protein OXD31_17290 [Chloroflexi bacterium]|nr:hypothetical protein [Chloroflexota bacterium]